MAERKFSPFWFAYTMVGLTTAITGVGFAAYGAYLDFMNDDVLEHGLNVQTESGPYFRNAAYVGGLSTIMLWIYKAARPR